VYGQVQSIYDLSCTWDRHEVEINRADMHFLHISLVAVGKLHEIGFEPYGDLLGILAMSECQVKNDLVENSISWVEEEEEEEEEAT